MDERSLEGNIFIFALLLRVNALKHLGVFRMHLHFANATGLSNRSFECPKKVAWWHQYRLMSSHFSNTVSDT